MAADIASPAITFLLDNLKQAVMHYVKLKQEDKTNIELLRNDLELLKSWLLDAAKKRKKKAFFTEMEKQIRDTVYDIEDTIDAWLIQAANQRNRSRMKKMIGLGRSLDLAEEVRSLRETRVKQMTLDAKDAFLRMPTEDAAADQSNTRVRRNLEAISLDNMVGFKDEEQKIIDFLKRDATELDIFAIIGMAGLGKTTLAWKVFLDPDIRFKYPTRIWVSVSEHLNMKEVLVSIMKALNCDGQDMSSYDEFTLAQMVRENLTDRTYLLVLDDIWTIDDWVLLSKVLPTTNNKGKVLITSRNYSVGARANVKHKPYELRFFHLEESWELLQLIVFGRNEKCPDDLEKLGLKIAKKCHGLPLAVVVIGGILINHFLKPMIQMQEAWENISNNVSSHLETNREQNVTQILAWSYDNLPDCLRDCFLYMGVFPEDYEIPISTVNNLWIAEGLTQEEGDLSLEGTAKENLTELISRNLVMAGRKNPNGELKTCRVHDVIRAFCIKKSQEQKLFHEIRLKDGQFEPNISDGNKYRRLCINSNLTEFLSKLDKNKTVRSFLSFYKEKFNLEEKHHSTIPESFSLLRVFETKSFNFLHFPLDVSKLLHLRYLTLCNDKLELLPEAICQLWNLKVLFIDTKSPKLEIEGDIWKMVQLRHFKTKASIVLAGEARGDGGENLQTMSSLSPEHCKVEVFRRARNLKKLGIRGKIEILRSTQAFVQLKHVENLKLVNYLESGVAAEQPLHHLRNSWPPRLRKLTLSATHLDWTYMSTLGVIEKLEVLKLKKKAFKGEEWNVVSGGFTSLQYLLISTSDLADWHVKSDDCFPKLRCLVIRNCKQLNGIPLNISKKLETVDLSHVSPSTVKSAGKIKEMKLENEGPGDSRFGGFTLNIGPECQNQHTD